MKKLTLSGIASVLILLSSCSKDPVVKPASNTPTQNNSQEVRIVSNWLTMDFTSGGRENPTGLEAVQYFNPAIYDDQKSTKLAFIRTSDSRRALPGSIIADGKQLRMSFLLTFASFKILVNADDDSFGGVSLSDCQFRYIVVPNSLIAANSDVDWSDYSQVAEALNLAD